MYFSLLAMPYSLDIEVADRVSCWRSLGPADLSSDGSCRTADIRRQLSTWGTRNTIVTRQHHSHSCFRPTAPRSTRL